MPSSGASRLPYPACLAGVLSMRGRYSAAVLRKLIGSFLLFLLETAVLSLPAAALAAMVMRGRESKCSESVPGLEPEKVAEGTGSVISGKTKGTARRPAWQVWLFYSLLIFLCWLPIFLAYYPSVFAYDAEGQLLIRCLPEITAHIIRFCIPYFWEPSSGWVLRAVPSLRVWRCTRWCRWR